MMSDILSLRVNAKLALVALLLGLAVTTAACGRKPAALDAPPNAIDYEYPPNEAAAR